MQKEREQKLLKNGSCVVDYDNKKNRAKKNWVDKRTEISREFIKLCQAEGLQVYFTMSETNAAVAEGTIPSLKKMLCRYMES